MQYRLLNQLTQEHSNEAPLSRKAQRVRRA